HFNGRCAQQRAVHGREALQGRTAGSGPWIGAVRRLGRILAELSGQLGVAGLKQADERAVPERSTDRLHFGKLVAAAEDVEKLRALTRRAPKRPPLIE